MRGGLKINRAEFVEQSSGDRVDWLDRFAEKMSQPTAVEQARLRDQKANSVYDQISQIMGNKNRKASTVQGVVDEYRSRLGLDKLSSQTNVNVKNANISSACDSSKILNEVAPNLKEDVIKRISNIISTQGRVRGGVATVQSEIFSAFKNQLSPGDIYNNEMRKYISDCLLEAELQNPMSSQDTSQVGKNVGLNDVSDTDDFFKGLMPYKG